MGVAQGSNVAGDGALAGARNDPFRLNVEPAFEAWLAQETVSLAFTTYEAGKIVLLGPGTAGKVSVAERNLGRAMALASSSGSLYLSTDHMVWRFENALRPGAIHDGWDRLYLPRTSHVTGAVDIHDMAVTARGELLAAVTLYDCIAALDAGGCFTPVWRPPFISRLRPEDRCHLNGLCLVAGRLAYATAIADTDQKLGWKERRADGGVIVETRTGRTIVDGLAMPHSPRWHRGRLWILESAAGWLGWIDLDAGLFHRVVWLPGFARGLCFHGDFAVIGLSKPRSDAFAGLPLEETLKSRGVEPLCGVFVVEVENGRVMARMTIEGSVHEIYDVAVLPGARQPLLVGLGGEEIRRIIVPGPDRSLRHQCPGATRKRQATN